MYIRKVVSKGKKKKQASSIAQCCELFLSNVKLRKELRNTKLGRIQIKHSKVEELNNNTSSVSHILLSSIL